MTVQISVCVSGGGVGWGGGGGDKAGERGSKNARRCRWSFVVIP